MENMWFMYVWIVFFVIIIPQQNSNRRRRQMGPRVQVELSEFIEIARIERGMIVHKKNSFLQPGTYVIRSGDYYYYTVTKDSMTIPNGCILTEAKDVLL